MFQTWFLSGYNLVVLLVFGFVLLDFVVCFQIMVNIEVICFRLWSINRVKHRQKGQLSNGILIHSEILPAME